MGVCTLPGAWQSSNVGAEVDEDVDHHGVSHDVLDVGPVVGVALEHGVDEVPEAFAVAAGDGTDPRRRLHDLQHQRRQILTTTASHPEEK